MGNHAKKYQAKLVKQLINRKENKNYYQNGSEWHTPATESERTARRKP